MRSWEVWSSEQYIVVRFAQNFKATQRAFAMITRCAVALRGTKQLREIKNTKT